MRPGAIIFGAVLFLAVAPESKDGGTAPERTRVSGSVPLARSACPKGSNCRCYFEVVTGRNGCSIHETRPDQKKPCRWTDGGADWFASCDSPRLVPLGEDFELCGVQLSCAAVVNPAAKPMASVDCTGLVVLPLSQGDAGVVRITILRDGGAAECL